MLRKGFPRRWSEPDTVTERACSWRSKPWRRRIRGAVWTNREVDEKAIDSWGRGSKGREGDCCYSRIRPMMRWWSRWVVVGVVVVGGGGGGRSSGGEAKISQWFGFFLSFFRSFFLFSTFAGSFYFPFFVAYEMSAGFRVNDGAQSDERRIGSFFFGG